MNVFISYKTRTIRLDNIMARLFSMETIILPCQENRGKYLRLIECNFC